MMYQSSIGHASSHIVQICRSEVTKTELWSAAKTSLHELPYLHMFE